MFNHSKLPMLNGSQSPHGLVMFPRAPPWAAGGPVQVSKRAPLRRSSVLAQHGGFFTATWSSLWKSTTERGDS